MTEYPEKNFIITKNLDIICNNDTINEETIENLVNEKNIILTNITSHNSEETYARLYINAFTEKDQIEKIIEYKEIIENYDYIEIIIYKNKTILKKIQLDSKTLDNRINKYTNKKIKELKK